MAKVRTISCKQAKKNPTKRTANPVKRKVAKKKVAKKTTKRTVAKKERYSVRILQKSGAWAGTDYLPTLAAAKRELAKLEKKRPELTFAIFDGRKKVWPTKTSTSKPGLVRWRGKPSTYRSGTLPGLVTPGAKSNPAKRTRDETDAIIAKIVESPTLKRNVPSGEWGSVKTALTVLVGNELDHLTSVFVTGVKKHDLSNFYVDARVKVKTVESGYSMGKVGKRALNEAVASLKQSFAKPNPSDLPKPSRKYRAKKAVRKAAGEAKEAVKRGGRRAAAATKEAAKKGGRKAAEMTKDAAVWTGKKVAKGGKRAGRKAWGTTKEAAKGAWAGIKKGWKENPTKAPKSVVDKVRRLQHKALELYSMSEKETRDSAHYYKEAEKLMHEAQNLAYEHGVDLSSTKGLPSAWEVANNPITAEQRKRMSLSLFALPKQRKYRLDSPARNKYSLTLLNKHYQDGVRTKQEYAVAYVNIMVAFIKNGQVAKRMPLVKTSTTLAAFKAASPLKNPASPVSVAAKKKAMQSLLKTCRSRVKTGNMTAANCKAIEARLKKLGTKSNPSEGKGTAESQKAATKKMRELMAERRKRNPTVKVPALHKWTIVSNTKRGTTYRWNNFMVKETPAPKGSGLYIKALFVDDPKHEGFQHRVVASLNWKDIVAAIREHGVKNNPVGLRSGGMWRVLITYVDGDSQVIGIGTRASDSLGKIKDKAITKASRMRSALAKKAVLEQLGAEGPSLKQTKVHSYNITSDINKAKKLGTKSSPTKLTKPSLKSLPVKYQRYLEKYGKDAEVIGYGKEYWDEVRGFLKKYKKDSLDKDGNVLHKREDMIEMSAAHLMSNIVSSYADRMQHYRFPTAKEKAILRRWMPTMRKGNPTKAAQRTRRLTTRVITSSIKDGKVYFGEDVKGRPLSVGPYHTATAKRAQYALFVGNLPVQVMSASDASAHFMAMAKPDSIRASKSSQGWGSLYYDNPTKKKTGANLEYMDTDYGGSVPAGSLVLCPKCRQTKKLSEEDQWYVDSIAPSPTNAPCDLCGKTSSKSGRKVNPTSRSRSGYRIVWVTEGEEHSLPIEGSFKQPGYALREGLKQIKEVWNHPVEKAWLVHPDGASKGLGWDITEDVQAVVVPFPHIYGKRKGNPTGKVRYRLHYTIDGQKRTVAMKSDTRVGAAAEAIRYIVEKVGREVGEADIVSSDGTRRSIKAIANNRVKGYSPWFDTTMPNPSKDVLHFTKKGSRWYVLHGTDWISVKADFAQSSIKSGQGVKVPWSHGKMAHHKPTDKVDNFELGLLLHQWHASMWDPIYAAGSTLVSGNKTTTATMARALDEIRKLRARSTNRKDKQDLLLIERNLEERVGHRRSGRVAAGAKSNPSGIQVGDVVKLTPEAVRKSTSFRQMKADKWTGRVIEPGQRGMWVVDWDLYGPLAVHSGDIVRSSKSMQLNYGSLDMSDPLERMAFATRPRGNPVEAGLTRSTKVPAISITLKRTEGGNHDLNEPHEVVGGDVWNKANVLLSLWGREAKEGEQNKVKYHIRYSDKETYSGTYYVSRKDQVSANLGKYMSTILKAAAGKAKPSYMTKAQYDAQKAKLTAAQRKQYADFLKRYEVGSPACKSCRK